MSHTVELELKIKDRELFKKVAKDLGLKVQENADVKLFSSTHSGLAVYLPGWKYPVVVSDDGALYYDNYDGNWGDIRELRKLQNRYGAELIKKEARKRGLSVRETVERDGTIVVEVVR